MDINVTIYETHGITSGFIVCNITAPNYDQFVNNGYNKNTAGSVRGGYNKSNVGNVLASQRIPAPNSTGILLPFLGLPNVPYCFIEIMVSPDGTRSSGAIWNVSGFNNSVGTTNRFEKINDPADVTDPSSSYIHYTIAI